MALKRRRPFFYRHLENIAHAYTLASWIRCTCRSFILHSLSQTVFPRSTWFPTVTQRSYPAPPPPQRLYSHRRTSPLDE